ncbi:MAG: DNA-3-methyladenine glycosylase 2 family protein [Acidobacteria bacterium]|nr:DNA-3-methyladenine glycosylase 2 family protein [Acidobacteriota bacterium]
MPSMQVTPRAVRGLAARHAIETLRAADPVLGAVIERAGPCRIEGRRDAFIALAEAIVHQQLSMKAAATIWKRFEGLFTGGRVVPDVLKRLSSQRLRGVGLSRQKIRYLKSLATSFEDGTLGGRELRRLGDEEVIESLTRLPGIGRWTAEMFLIFCLKRPDVWPVDDLGLLKGLKRLFRLRRLPKREKALALGERWRPYRTVATWYLWRGLDEGGIG